MIRCLFCGELSQNRYPICNSCKPSLLIQSNRCKRCGIITSKFIKICCVCRDSDTQLLNHSLFMYNGYPKELLKQYKFNKEMSLAYYYSELLYEKIVTSYNGFTVCPIPTSYIKRRLKGWYQLDLILSLLKKRSIPISNILGKRLGKTQKKLNRDQRLSNLNNKFYIKRGEIPQKILLLDDVYTTGATLNSCYQLLKPFSETIHALTLYRD